MEESNQVMNNTKERNKPLLQPKIDVVFHSLFRKNNLELTSNFVSSLIQKRVKIIDMDKDRNLTTRHPDEKLGILDLRTELEEGTICNIEIQLANEGNIIDRILYYWSRAFSEQLKKGEDYKNLHKTIAILIIDFELQEMKKFKELGLRWVIMADSEEKMILTEKLEIRIIEIPKAKKIIKEESKNEIAQWMLFLDNPNSVEVSEIMYENKEIKEAVDELEEISQDEELRRVAFLKEKYEHDEAQRKYYHEQQEKEIKYMEEEIKRKKKQLEEIEQRKQEIECGKQEIERGKQEVEREKQEVEREKQEVEREKQEIKQASKTEKAQIIKNMLDKGFDIEEISSIMNMSIDDMKELINNK